MTSRTRRRGIRWLLCLSLLPIASTRPLTSSAPADPPQVLFKDLFIAVQTAQIYPDGKAFADAVPGAPPNEILKQYHAEQPDSPAALKQFVEAHFCRPR
jgi:alpha,alpha-trehalase